MSDDEEKDRVRENARAFIEECRREQDAWVMREATVRICDWATRQNVPLTWAINLFRGIKNYGEEAPENARVHAQKAKKSRVRGVCDRLNGLSDDDVKWLRDQD